MSTLIAPPPARLAPPRLTAAPAAEPPFEACGDGSGSRPGAAWNLVVRRPPGAPGHAPPRAPLTVGQALPRRARTGAVPDPEHWGGLLARGIVEVIAGDRPVTQLLHWTAPHVYDVLCRRALAATSACTAERVARPRAMAGRVHVCRPAAGVAEVTSVVHGRARAWALAFRLEERHDRWLCTELLLG